MVLFEALVELLPAVSQPVQLEEQRLAGELVAAQLPAQLSGEVLESGE